MIIPPRQFFLPFLKKEQLTQDAFLFSFDRSKVAFDFTAGQYIRMTLNVENPDERGTTRLFSIVSAPFEKDILQITTRIIQSSFKKTLVKINPGTQIQFFGPMGMFILKEENPGSYIFLAGGIGITPFHSMIKSVVLEKKEIDITFIVSFSTTQEMIFYDELSEIALKNKNIKVIYTITHPEESSRPWTGETGRISQELIKKYVKTSLDCTYYIAGPPKMVEVMEQIVKEMGVVQGKIKKENFVGY